MIISILQYAGAALLLGCCILLVIGMTMSLIEDVFRKVIREELKGDKPEQEAKEVES